MTDSTKQMLDDLRIDRARAPRSKLPFLLAVTTLVIVAAGAGAFWWLNRPSAPVVRAVVVQETTSGGDNTLLNASGYVTARREATVSSKVTGKVVEVLVEEGMEVEAGQVLARTDSSNVEMSLRLSEAQLESARQALGETRANLDRAEREFRRIAQLAAKGFMSESERDLAESEAKSLRARLERQQADVDVAEREIALWKQQVDDTVVRAPFSGVVTSKDAQPGEMVSPISAGGGFTRTGICTIVDMSSLEIEVDVSESYINRVQAGQPVVARLDSYPDLAIPAKVIAIIPTADRQKATVKVRVGFDKLDPRILPDMSVKVAFQGTAETQATRREILIPKSAVRRDGGQDIVWLVRDGRVERRAVTVEGVRGEEAAIAAGLGGGDKVVVEGPDGLTDGEKVTEATG